MDEDQDAVVPMTVPIMLKFKLVSGRETAERLMRHYAADDRSGHVDGGRWSWIGVFSLSADSTYTWSCARGSSGMFAASKGQLLILPTESADQDGIERAEGRPRPCGGAEGRGLQRARLGASAGPP